MAFSEVGTFHLCFTLNWNKLINVIELCFTTDLSKQNAAFLMCSENRLSQISLSSKDSGVKEVFYHYMLLNPKELAGFISSPLLEFFPRSLPDTIPLAFSKHWAFPGTLSHVSWLFFPHVFHFFIFCTMEFAVPCLHSESVCVSVCWFYQSDS